MMIDWDNNIVKLIIFLIYGTTFISMFLVLTLWKKKITNIEFMDEFGTLAIFALLQGLSGYCDIPRYLNWQPVWIFDIAKLILASTSFAALLSFGLNIASTGIEEKRWIRGIPHGALLMYLCFLIFMGFDIAPRGGTGINYDIAELVQRYSLGFLGAVITSYAFFELSGKIKTIAEENAGRKFINAGAGFALYAISVVLMENLIMGIPTVLFSCIIVIYLTIVIINIFQLFELKRSG